MTVEEVYMAILASLTLGIFIPLVGNRLLDSSAGRLSILAPSLAALALSIAVLARCFDEAVSLWNGRLVVDGFASLLLTVLLFVGASLMAGSLFFAKSLPAPYSYFSITYITVLSAALLVSVSSVSVFFASWILLSVASYVIAGLEKNRAAADAALKYAILGGISTVFLILWIGTASYFGGDVLLGRASSTSSTAALLGIGGILLMIAVGFKVGVFPFHWWLPDVYTQVNGTLVSVLTGVVKIAAFAAFIRILTYSVADIGSPETLIIVVALLSALTMTFGNIAALTTRNIQRILAFSSIAHVGYLLLGVVALLSALSMGQGDRALASYAIAAMTVHLLAYALSKPGTFLFAGSMRTVLLEDVRGAYKRDGLASIAAAILLLSLLGVPPTAGFWGKLYLFQAALPVSPELVLLAIINSGISSFYYIRIVREMFSEPEKAEASASESAGAAAEARASLVVFSVLTVVLGLGILSAIVVSMTFYMP
uniref:NADH:quinone oxidoreductase/Mrp antiporter transmembrane domain-containing protein n=1 Tax=Fervidicoccus fontis TaxID=683846 RepID=A0A7J3ZLV2_9CREN